MFNPIIIVLPILAILMFELGLNLNLRDFKGFIHKPLSVIIGLIGQIIVLPIIAFLIAYTFNVEPLFFIGIMLIACCPGGSSSNIFSMIAKGDIALSVLLTSLSSTITLFTIPIIMSFTIDYVNIHDQININLPIGKLIIQNIVLMLVPIVLGVLSKKYLPKFAQKANVILQKFAFPALPLLVVLFFIQHYTTIIEQFGTLFFILTILIISSIVVSMLMSYLAKLNKKEKRTIVIEVGMQNAASAIAIASSPYIFNNDIIAIPAIVYALIMNIVLLSYIQIQKRAAN